MISLLLEGKNRTKGVTFTGKRENSVLLLGGEGTKERGNVTLLGRGKGGKGERDLMLSARGVEGVEKEGRERDFPYREKGGGKKGGKKATQWSRSPGKGEALFIPRKNARHKTDSFFGEGGKKEGS